MNTTLLKYTLGAALAFAACLSPVAPKAEAQTMVGEWTQFPVYGVPSKMLVTNDGGMFYLCSSQLYSMSADGVFTNMASILHSANVTASHYSPEGKFLAIGYQDGNIDIINDGDINPINLSEIKDAALNSSKKINDFEYYDGRLYVATDFGLVVYDVKKKIVLKSGIYNVAINNVATVGDYVVLVSGTNYYFAPMSAKLNRLVEYATLQGGVVKEIRRLGNDKVLSVNFGSVSTWRYDSAEKAMVAGAGWSEMNNVNYLMADKEGGFYTSQDSKLWRISSEAGRTLSVNLPSVLANNALGICGGLDNIWAANAAGIGLYSLTADGTGLTTLAERSIPEGAMNVAKVEFISASPDGSRIYFTNVGSGRLGANSGQAMITDRYENGVFTPVQAANGAVKSSNRVAEDPDDPEIIWTASRNGIYAIKDGKVLATYNSSNAPFRSIAQSYTLTLDHEGNLWVGAQNDANDTNSGGLKMLPSASRKKVTGVDRSEWFVYDKLEGYNALWEGDIEVCKQSNMVVAVGAGSKGIAVINTRGTLGNGADDSCYYFKGNLTDTDGHTFDPGLSYAVVEDLRGRVWVGCSTGVYYINNNELAMQGTLEVGRPKVARNDGTNTADYLLDGTCVLDITVDGLNRIWIGAETGVFCYDEDTYEIVEQFNTSNSLLTTNNCRAIYADQRNNLIYVGTQLGSFCYASTSIPGAASLDEVYAYPNPVKPDYTGWITISGLMDGTLVKIADMSGKVVHSGRSEGGMYVWDGCSSDGSRVRSGVYVVYASAVVDDHASSAATKILILN